ncbi:cysteine desulfurase [Flavobacteriales bacterium]|nr:cysteine desulfurase [Flavobacteriales bacterium]
MYSAEKIRKSFPILNSEVNQHKLVYLDNAATTQKHQSVIDAVSQFYEKENSNIHRGVHYLSQLSTNKFEQTRKCVKDFINAQHTHEVIFTKGTTDSINLLAFCYSKILEKGDEVIVSEMEHHSNLVPWQMCCDYSQAILKVIPITSTGELDMSFFKKELNSKTKLVALTHISNSLGTINPIEKIIELTHQTDAKILIDGAQAAAHINVDVQRLDVDFYCFSAHKLYGPTGVGVLYGKEELLNMLPPYQGGGEMIKDVSIHKTTYAGLPHKFEAGTPNIAGVIAFKNAIEFIKDIGVKNMKDHEDSLLKYATLKLKNIPSLSIIGTAAEKSGIISFIISDIHHYDLGLILDKLGVAIRTGHHCTQPVMRKMNISGTSRISFACYNTKKEVDYTVECIKKAIKMLS